MKQFLLTLSLALGAVLAAGPAGAITGGEPTGAAHGNVGLLGFDRDGASRGFCSGTLIAPTIFLTAGHCTAALAAAGVPVWVSFDVPDDEVASVPIAVASLHSAFSPDFGVNGVDICVAVLASSASGIQPAELAPLGYLDELDAAGELRAALFTSVGYGRCERETGGGPPAFCAGGVRRMATSPFMAINDTWLRLFANETVTGEGGTCFGDSGGPQLHDGLIVSITTGGDGACRAHNVNFRVDTPAAQAFLADFVDLD